MQIKKSAKGLTSGFRLASSTEHQATDRPSKYDPPSPKNIFPKGQLSTKTPKMAAMIKGMILARALSPTCTAITMMPNKDQVLTHEHRPLKPSMILIDWVTPPTAKAVKRIASGVKPSK